ncbi:hypothetical protein BGW36DRAFT_293123 [Talaromyces proteolyticus]|uniref:Uncharacterized protein n=1 Tax=Talaromyces proteolyticus TaxID=1131652 RepID=A0AAD4L0L6_9EURO|nr:uncharacterized protein BGW36DRAFT_293123 [Talaromyces proteolyticus]KAH8700694.1 hypothetical protein BGW36DRAFT_293123 [Talaromyces proteolyticus]
MPQNDLEVGPSLPHQQLAILRAPSILFSPRKPSGAAFTINSKDWYDENYDPGSKNKDSMSRTPRRSEDIWETVYGTAGAVYGVAKVFVALCRSFRIDLHMPTAGMLNFIDKAEVLLRNGSVIDFVFTIEDLYSSLYARLEVEIALLHFCAMFGINDGKAWRRTDPTLPEPGHLYTIMTACQQVLTDKSVCSTFDDHLVKYHQRRFVEEMTRKYQVDGTLPPDSTGYRAHADEIIQDAGSLAFRHWCKIFPEMRFLPIGILAFLSEKYVSIYPRPLSQNSQMKINISFGNIEPENKSAWDKDMIRAHRLCTLAQIEGKSVGELRREEEPSNVLRYASERKCVCLEICTCSRLCTKFASTLCPCSFRWVRGIMIHRPEYDIGYYDKSTIMGELTYESLAALQRDKPEDVVRRELYGGINVIREEMIKHHMAFQTGEIDILLVS